jgi:hypothetical protein
VPSIATFTSCDVKEIPVSPFRVFGAAARPSPSPTRVVLFWNRPLVQSFRPAEVSPLLLLRSRYAVGTLPRLCGLPAADCCRRLFRLPAASSRRTSPSFRVLPSNTYPAIATTESSHGLLVPSAHQESEVHSSRANPARYVPPSGFGCPLDGLLPRIPCQFCFTPAALLGFTLRRFPLPASIRGLSTGKNPHTVGSAVFPPPKRQTGPTSLGFWVQTHQDCLATARGFSPTATGASLGFCPSRACLRRPCPGLLPDSSHVLRPPWRLLTEPAHTSEYRSAFAPPRPTDTEAPACRSDPYGVSAPARS